MPHPLLAAVLPADTPGSDLFCAAATPVLSCCCPALFIGDLTDAVLVKDAADLALVLAALAKEGLTLAEMDKEWQHSRIKRKILAGPITQAAVQAVLEKWEGKECPLTGKLVVTEAVRKVFDNQCVADIELDGKLYNTWDLVAGATKC
jgi:hypothetical protein